MINTFRELQNIIKRQRSAAKGEALKLMPVVRSRGTWLCACDGEGLMNENGEDLVTTLDGLLEFMGDWRQKATVIFIDGGFDGATSVHDMNEYREYEPWLSEWSVEIWNEVDGWLV